MDKDKLRIHNRIHTGEKVKIEYKISVSIFKICDKLVEKILTYTHGTYFH